MNFVNHFFEIHVFFPMSANHDILSISKSSKVIVEEKKKKKTLMPPLEILISTMTVNF